MTDEKVALLWFRKGLRLHDNSALQCAQQHAGRIFPVFCLDPWFVKSGNVGANRLNFLLESLEDLNSRLRHLGSRLIVCEGNPVEVLPRVLAAWKVQVLCYEKDTEPYALARDSKVASAARDAGIEVHATVGHTLWDTQMLIARNQGKAPGTMSSFQALIRKVGVPRQPHAAPEALPAVTDEDLESAREDLFDSTGHVPTLEQLGLEAGDISTPFKGGETEALQRLEKYMARTSWVCKFEKPKGNPADFDPEPATTVLSPYLKFGCLSVHKFYHDVAAVYGKGGKHTEPPVSLHGQLLWREFFYTVGYDTPNFHQMEGNPSIRQIPWQTDPERLAAWEAGRTGYPWVDAIMVQLKQWGWMHHLARHSVACFLTRGDLWCHWEAGRDVFDKYLIDADHFINNGNWQWLSCSNFFFQFFRVYSPVTFGKKYDPSGKFIRHFLPVLKKMPDKYIYEPWKAPKEVQQRAGCIIGKDYPRPIVDHATASSENKDRIKAAYDAQKAGASAQQAPKRKRTED